MRHYFLNKTKSTLFLCLIIIFGKGTSQAKFLNPRDAKTSPQARLASYASSTIGTNFLGLEDLGQHSYRPDLSEKNGIIYTCKAGHIDIAHVRKLIDWTAFLAAKIYDNLIKNKAEFTFTTAKPSIYHLNITYPQYWTVLSEQQKEKAARDISIKVGQYAAFTASTWHEILTWFGYKSLRFYTDFPSAFSWEDTFSNVFGSHIAVMALTDSEHEFNEAVTLALDRELEKLGVQSARTAKRASKEVRGLWFSGDLLFVNIKKRNFDIGLDDGFITPFIVPSLAECEGAEAQAYPVPNLAFLSEYGFSVQLKIKPRAWEKDKILRVVYPQAENRSNWIEPDIHFAPIMDYIKKEAVEKYGYNLSPDR
jgi:hypothetical protein